MMFSGIHITNKGTCTCVQINANLKWNNQQLYVQDDNDSGFLVLSTFDNSKKPQTNILFSFEFPPPLNKFFYFDTVIIILKTRESLTLQEFETKYDLLRGNSHTHNQKPIVFNVFRSENQNEILEESDEEYSSCDDVSDMSLEEDEEWEEEDTDLLVSDLPS